MIASEGVGGGGRGLHSGGGAKSRGGGGGGAKESLREAGKAGCENGM